MPANERSLRLTEVYRDRLQNLVNRVSVPARALWGEHIDFDNLDASYEPVQARTADLIQRSQRQAVQLSAAYFAGFVGLEEGKIGPVPKVDSAQYVGQSFGSKVLVDSLRSPLIATLVAIEEQQKEPLAIGLRTLMANIDLDVKAAGRRALLDLISSDVRVEGWQRAVRGTCAACAASPPHGDTMPVHPHCQCVPEPKVRGTADAMAGMARTATLPDLPRRPWKPASGSVDSEGFIRLYHGTSKQILGEIEESGVFKMSRTAMGKWGTFTDSAEQARAYAFGDKAVLEIRIPAEDAPRFLWKPEPHTAYGFPDAQAYAMREDLPLADFRATARPTGQQLFDAMTPAEQDAAIGPAAAEKIRAGEATLADFIEVDGPFLRQRPLKDLQ